MDSVMLSFLIGVIVIALGCAGMAGLAEWIERRREQRQLVTIRLRRDRGGS